MNTATDQATDQHTKRLKELADKFNEEIKTLMKR